MAKITKISASAIDDSLREVTRQYLAGDLQKPQILQHFPSKLVEIGITRYGPEGGKELPHTHKQAFEFQLMITGTTAYLDLVTKEEHVFSAGDFYIIEPGVVYAQKAAANTEILFIKAPPGNDKIPWETDAQLDEWFDKRIETGK
jgi:8-oxo-dGTP diphosphatase